MQGNNRENLGWLQTICVNLRHAIENTKIIDNIHNQCGVLFIKNIL